MFFNCVKLKKFCKTKHYNLHLEKEKKNEFAKKKSIPDYQKTLNQDKYVENTVTSFDLLEQLLRWSIIQGTSRTTYLAKYRGIFNQIL